jgi:hypothetical protein
MIYNRFQKLFSQQACRAHPILVCVKCPKSLMAEFQRCDIWVSGGLVVYSPTGCTVLSPSLSSSSQISTEVALPYTSRICCTSALRFEGSSWLMQIRNQQVAPLADPRARQTHSPSFEARSYRSPSSSSSCLLFF